MPPSAAVRADRGSPVIAIINDSADVDTAKLKPAVAALQRQIDEHFFPLWGWRAKLSFGKPIPADSMQVRILAVNPDHDDAEGYHFSKDGLPRSEVYTRDNADEFIGYPELFATLSHELLEMIADPGVNLYARGHYIAGKRHMKAFIGYEVCDAVQDKTYEIDRILVSDFVTPEWFEASRRKGSVKFSYLGSVREPFALTSGGYIDGVAGNRFFSQEGKHAKRSRKHRMNARKARV
jgi:hypothetical protein